MKTSQAGIELIKKYEGLKLWRYLDAAAIPTYGYGHVIRKDDPPEHITKEQAEAFLISDLAQAEQCINSSVKSLLTQYQFDALVSFVFNVGCNAFKNSTLLDFLNQGKYVSASAQFVRWNKVTVSGQKVDSEGLTKRRLAERELFLRVEE